MLKAITLFRLRAVTVKTAFYNNRQTIDMILMLSFGQGGTNARRCEGKEVVLEETRL